MERAGREENRKDWEQDSYTTPESW